MQSALARAETNAHERFKSVVLPHLADAQRLAQHLTRSRADSQDVVQEAVVRLLKFIHGYRGGDSRAWVLKVVRNTTFTWLSTNRRPDHLPIEDHAGAVPPSDGSLSADHAVNRACGNPSPDFNELLELIHRLSGDHREILILRHLKGFSYRDISITLRIPSGTVMSRLSRAHIALARLVQDLQ